MSSIQRRKIASQNVLQQGARLFQEVIVFNTKNMKKKKHQRINDTTED